MSYLDKFTRGERRLTSYELSSYTESIRSGNVGTLDDLKLHTLYRDCFAPHVTDYFDSEKKQLVLSSQNDRLIDADNLTSVFLLKYYGVPKIQELGGESNRHFKKYDLGEFRKRVTSNPIDTVNPSHYDLGTNKVSYLIGDIGVGKSTFVSRLNMDVLSDKEKDKDGYVVVPIVYDFEIRHKDGDKLKNIDDSFWEDLYNHIHDVVFSDVFLVKSHGLEEVQDMVINPKNPDGSYHKQLKYYIRQLIYELAKRKIRLFLMFDNLDRYHFFYTKHSFFDFAEKELFETITANISVLVNAFDRKDLWKSGLCVLFVCRRYLYDYLSSFMGDVIPKDNNFGVYELIDVSVRQVVSSRFDLFEDAVSVLDGNKIIADKEQYFAYLEHLKGLITVRETAKRIKYLENPVLEALSKICHNGHRSMVKFLDTLSLTYKDADAIDRLLVSQPHLLLILYVCDNKKRYSQEQQHFPNLFLADCLVSPDRNFRDLYKTHKHSYWIKYLILKYLYIREEEKDYCSAQDVINLFSANEGYEEHLVKLALGSLCTTNEFSCIRIDYNNDNSINDCRLTLTNRGRYLVSHDKYLFPSEGVEYCFNFHYLQLVVEDKLIAIPKRWYEDIMVKGFDYGYLYLSKEEYGMRAMSVIKSKIRAVVYFLRLIDASLRYEMKGKDVLFEHLKEKKVIPNIRHVVEEFMKTVKLLLSVQNRSNELSDYRKLCDSLFNDDEFDIFFEGLKESDLYVVK